MIPTETFENIAQYLAPGDLRNLSLVSRFYCSQAVRVLYHAVDTRVTNGQMQLKDEFHRMKLFIRTMQSAPHLALLVQEFKFQAPSSFEQLYDNSKWTAIFSAPIKGADRPFRHMFNLRKLAIEAPDPWGNWPTYLNSFPDTGLLEELMVSLHPNNHIMAFLCRHRSIRTLCFPFLSSVELSDAIHVNIARLPIVQLTTSRYMLPLVTSWTNLTHLQYLCDRKFGGLRDDHLAALDVLGPRLTNLKLNGEYWFQLSQWADRTPNLKVLSLLLHSLINVCISKVVVRQ